MDLSQSHISLKIDSKLELDSLELLDGFNAAGVEALLCYYFLRLDSLGCRLFREGPLPDVLIIYTQNNLNTKISEQIAHNIADKHWKKITLYAGTWEELMKPTERPIHITLDILRLFVPCHGNAVELQNNTFASMEDNLTTAKSLTLNIYNPNYLATATTLLRTLVWISMYFRDMDVLSIGYQETPLDLIYFIQTSQIEVINNPSLTSIKISNIECSVYQKQKKAILCFSLNAWALYREGKLANALTQSQADLSQLSAEHQEMVMSPKPASDKSELLCIICQDTYDELRDSSLEAAICILDHPAHRVCSSCLDRLAMVGKSSGYIVCPVCRSELSLPLLKHEIQQNAQGSFELTITNTLSCIWSFPN
ncbi:hypothetical protein NEDG_01776 [Nematocida displodere]|uniref:RING-type domain-containing protein n=1 Tax=Nematocida displodere TaxID=1805483 RepID=A0A177EHE6_9MICR|nr:hypothetical protein NEDG_01776 [Nematocida displodere]